MKFASLALLSLLATPSVVIVAARAEAQTQTDCTPKIANLRTTAGGIAISGKKAAKDHMRLIRRLDAASTELAKGKNAHAATKLADFKIKVQKLADATRVSGTDAASLLGQADAAIACLNGSTAT